MRNEIINCESGIIEYCSRFYILFWFNTYAFLRQTIRFDKWELSASIVCFTYSQPWAWPSQLLSIYLSIFTYGSFLI